jgi:flagellin
MSVSISDIEATALGVNALAVSTFTTANACYYKYQSAIETVSESRSALGAVQNRLEHTIANLDTTAENTQAAESRIRDVDMAAEMVTYSKMLFFLRLASQCLLRLISRHRSFVTVT